MFSIVKTASSLAETLAPLGTKRKFWYRDGDRRMLFKEEERGTGEDWAEKVACELSELLGIPHVRYELAWDSDRDTPGFVCETCAPRNADLVLGNQIMLELDPEYPAEGGKRYKSGVRSNRWVSPHPWIQLPAEL